MNCWFRAGCLILSNCFVGKTAWQKEHVQFCCKSYNQLTYCSLLLYLLPPLICLKATPSLCQKKLFKQIAIRICCLGLICVLSGIFFLESFVRSQSTLVFSTWTEVKEETWSICFTGVCSQESKNMNTVPVLLMWSALSINCQPTILLCVSLLLCSKF